MSMVKRKDFEVLELFVNPFQFCFYLFAVCFAARGEIFEFDCIVDDFYMESKEGSVISNADAIDTAVADELFAVGYVSNAVGFFYFRDDTANRVKHLAR